MPPRQNESLQDNTASIRSAVAVNPGGGNVVLNRISRGIYIGTAGNLAVQFADDPDAGSVVLVGLAVGVWHPMQVQRILQSGSTAGSVLVGY